MRDWLGGVAALSAAAGLGLLPLGFAAEGAQYTAQVVKVKGLMLVVKIDGKRENVRLIGLEAPKGQTKRWTAEAERFIQATVSGNTVSLVTDAALRDPKRHLLAYAYVGSTFLNAEVVRRGYALAVTRPPNVRQAKELLDAQRDAQNARAGYWATASEAARSETPGRRSP